MVFDVPTDPAAESTYQCLDCGETVRSHTRPGACPECVAEVQNRAMSLE